jgi:hypothetical protein
MSSYAVLPREERRALLRRLGWQGDAAKALEDAGFAAPARESDLESRVPTTVLLTDLPAAVLAGLVQLTGCQGNGLAGDRAITTTYRLDGRPLSITLGWNELDPSCDRLFQLIARASYGEPTVPGGEPRLALLRLLPEFVACQNVRDAEFRQPFPVPCHSVVNVG